MDDNTIKASDVGVSGFFPRVTTDVTPADIKEVATERAVFVGSDPDTGKDYMLEEYHDAAGFVVERRLAIRDTGAAAWPPPSVVVVLDEPTEPTC